MNPQNPLDPAAASDAPTPTVPQPGQSIEPTLSAATEPATEASPAQPMSEEVVPTGSLDPADVASDPSPLDEPTTSMPQPEAFQPDFLKESDPAMATPPTPAPEPMVPPAQPELAMPTPVTVTVEQQPAQPAQAPSAVPSFLSQSKPAEPAAPAMPPQPMAPAPAVAQDAPGLPPVIVQAGKKSKLWVLIVIILVVVLAGGGAAAYFLVVKKKDKSTDTQKTDTSQTSDDGKKTDTDDNANATTKPAVTAEYSSELDAVCNNTPVSNATAYTTNQAAVIYTFHNKPGDATSWTSDLVGYGKSYYPDIDDFKKTSVIACLSADESTVGAGLSCDYTDSKDQKVTVSYKPLKYELSFYEATTAKKIGDSQTIDAPAASCPSIIAYDASTKTAYATPDDGALEAAYDAFVK